MTPATTGARSGNFQFHLQRLRSTENMQVSNGPPFVVLHRMDERQASDEQDNCSMGMQHTSARTTLAESQPLSISAMSVCQLYMPRRQSSPQQHAGAYNVKQARINDVRQL